MGGKAESIGSDLIRREYVALLIDSDQIGLQHPNSQRAETVRAASSKDPSLFETGATQARQIIDTQHKTVDRSSSSIYSESLSKSFLLYLPGRLVPVWLVSLRLAIFCWRRRMSNYKRRLPLHHRLHFSSGPPVSTILTNPARCTRIFFFSPYINTHTHIYIDSHAKSLYCYLKP